MSWVIASCIKFTTWLVPLFWLSRIDLSDFSREYFMLVLCSTLDNFCIDFSPQICFCALYIGCNWSCTIHKYSVVHWLYQIYIKCILLLELNTSHFLLHQYAWACALLGDIRVLWSRHALQRAQYQHFQYEVHFNWNFV